MPLPTRPRRYCNPALLASDRRCQLTQSSLVKGKERALKPSRKELGKLMARCCLMAKITASLGYSGFTVCNSGDVVEEDENDSRVK